MAGSQTRYPILQLQDHSNDLPALQSFYRDVVKGLESIPKSLPSRYFYDDRGSELFQKITELDEYYPASCERDILSGQSENICRYFGDDFGLIELGPGDGHKSYHILQALLSRNTSFRYYPVDISSGAMEPLQENIQDLQGLEFHGLVGDYETGLQYLAGREQRHVVLFLGSSIGNFSLSESADFLRRIRMSLHEGDVLLIGFDLVKDPSILIPAYSDSAGVTAEFNLNLLERIKRELNAELDAEAFIHHAAFNPRNHAMESFLISTEKQRISIQDPVSGLKSFFDLAAYESIQTETSQKYTGADLQDLACKSGFRIEADFMDSRGFFTDSLWIADAR
ncbi:MAG: L-histidine N(alpha)-methyltransferase [Spirochaetaceae bacterium]|nr:L-histidine N(alpha)-methyltransferase [Spirochaetaceae bacterium]|tara:strand:- start:64171 stop:65184 length:1014 start_codon:yes stop_codon:yes gene_type:complete